MKLSELSNTYNVCIRCGRKLKTPESRELGFGPTCFKKQNEPAKIYPLFEEGDNNAQKQH